MEAVRTTAVMAIVLWPAVLALDLGQQAFAADVCQQAYERHGLSQNFHEAVAHAVHSMTAADLRLFNPRMTFDNNKIPVVNPQQLHGNPNDDRVLPSAPEAPLGHDFYGDAMNTVDAILSNIGQNDDGLGPHWSPLERIVHALHMKDLWSAVLDYTTSKLNKTSVNSDKDLCPCLLDTDHNGIRAAVAWIAKHYSADTPMLLSLTNEPIPRLVDSQSWLVWRARMLLYYNDAAFRDVTLFLHCATKDA